MSRITDSARDEACTIRLPMICNGDKRTTVFAHLSGVRFGHGVGQKVPDYLGAYACSACHAAIDGQVKTQYSKEYLKLAHLEGHAETLIKLNVKGLIYVK